MRTIRAPCDTKKSPFGELIICEGIILPQGEIVTPWGDLNDPEAQSQYQTVYNVNRPFCKNVYS